MTTRRWTYAEKIRLRVGMRFGLLETEALALEGDTLDELEAAAMRVKAERVDDLHADLQRKLAPRASEPDPSSPPRGPGHREEDRLVEDERVQHAPSPLLPSPFPFARICSSRCTGGLFPICAR